MLNFEAMPASEQVFTICGSHLRDVLSQRSVLPCTLWWPLEQQSRHLIMSNFSPRYLLV